ncbi:hypothetical protein FN846DRAFT_892677 [Sphaerosporella brunnea]|uniref:RING-type domain-containing protein n=1 Tax=Sphaerosporella brunnea TaxID=1250544 RepID=A0A5J5EPJ7_9PEZI|nr:hypothetical protein FN846DRAFT_892677 [Sphaerosporella brunnea]
MPPPTPRRRAPLRSCRLPAGTPAPPADCVICLAPLKVVERTVLTPCSHALFHHTCIRTWLGGNEGDPRCPMCRRRVLELVAANGEVDVVVPVEHRCDVEGCDEIHAECQECKGRHHDKDAHIWRDPRDEEDSDWVLAAGRGKPHRPTGRRMTRSLSKREGSRLVELGGESSQREEESCDGEDSEEGERRTDPDWGVRRRVRRKLC